MIINASDLCRVRLCAGHQCPEDAQTGWALCATCDAKRLAGRPFKLHETPTPHVEDPNADLRCSNCHQYKPDDAYYRKNRASRRGRHHECKACDKERSRKRRAANPERVNAQARARRAAKAAKA